MAIQSFSWRYTVLVLLVLFGLLWYVNVNDDLNRKTTHFKVVPDRKVLLEVLRKLGETGQVSEFQNQLAKEIHIKETNLTTSAVSEQDESEIGVTENHPAKIIISRVESTQKVCEEKQFANKYTEFKFKDTGHMIVDEKHKFIFCYIPKVSCSTWKRVFRSLYLTHKSGLRQLNAFTSEEIEYRLKNYRKAMFVRDPITRFLSAFLHKFYTAKDGVIHIWERTYGSKIIKLYRPWMQLEKGQLGLNITVSEFIKYVADLGEDLDIDPLRDHWLPMYRSCDPCKFQPEFIGHFENLEIEGPYLLKWLGVNDYVAFPEYHSSNAADGLINAYANAEMGLMRKLRAFYHRDYELFNYSANDTMRKVLFGE
ncbi:carbohydrate sulfotransferase 11-like isoform X3 [Anneissia japonica]|uniref:carbohydrate sulfotransferase 11-like isoform X3 n=1 Tax=Anneissia japonica TaxID=1529436 RepID=UPI001425786B|nr:carbohydrate sulfotransferase 11-like isoform X3 [Anneissia japonica]